MKKAKPMFIAVFLAMIVVLSGITFVYWYSGYNYIITENAYVDGTIIKVGPQVPGKYLEIMVSEGDRVTAGQIIARNTAMNIGLPFFTAIPPRLDSTYLISNHSQLTPQSPRFRTVPCAG